MLVLDIDLDFFVDPIFSGRDDNGPRPPDRDCRIWSRCEANDFMRNRCRLSRSHPVPGVLVTHHHEAFFRLRHALAHGLLTPPFDLVHIDAHADLGHGDEGWVYIATDLLQRPPYRRRNPRVGGYAYMNPGNYLCFLIACRWIRSLTIVRPRKETGDLPPIMFRDFESGGEALQLRALRPEDVADATPEALRQRPPMALEPPVPFRLLTWDEWTSDRRPDFVVAAQSPAYAPVSADHLLNLIGSYIRDYRREAPQAVRSARTLSRRP